MRLVLKYEGRLDGRNIYLGIRNWLCLIVIFKTKSIALKIQCIVEPTLFIGIGDDDGNIILAPTGNAISKKGIFTFAL
jgi:hypothetical protein